MVGDSLLVHTVCQEDGTSPTTLDGRDDTHDRVGNGPGGVSGRRRQSGDRTTAGGRRGEVDGTERETSETVRGVGAGLSQTDVEVKRRSRDEGPVGRNESLVGGRNLFVP